MTRCPWFCVALAAAGGMLPSVSDSPSITMYFLFPCLSFPHRSPCLFPHPGASVSPLSRPCLSFPVAPPLSHSRPPVALAASARGRWRRAPAATSWPLPPCRRRARALQPPNQPPARGARGRPPANQRLAGRGEAGPPLPVNGAGGRARGAGLGRALCPYVRERGGAGGGGRACAVRRGGARGGPAAIRDVGPAPGDVAGRAAPDPPSAAVPRHGTGSPTPPPVAPRHGQSRGGGNGQGVRVRRWECARPCRRVSTGTGSVVRARPGPSRECGVRRAAPAPGGRERAGALSREGGPVCGGKGLPRYRHPALTPRPAGLSLPAGRRVP